MQEIMEKKFKEFKPTSWAIDNKLSIFVLAIIVSTFGLLSYLNLPKEQFPEIVIPTIMVNTVYPGTSPSDIENLITRPIEKNIKSINGVKNITSSSVQDISSIVVEFNTGIEVKEAKQLVKDAVDKTARDLPNDLPSPVFVKEIDFSEIPIMYVNISGNFDLDRLKKYADVAKDKIESLKEITRVDIVGALDREIQINVDMYRMQAASVTFSDIQRAIAGENITISGGSITMHGMARSIRVVGEFTQVDKLKNISLSSSSGAIVKLGDVAEISDSFHDQESFARLNNENVITMNIIKKSGQNLLNAADQIKVIMADLGKTRFPKDLKVTVTGDMSHYTRSTLSDLNNTIIIGFILVTIVLMFFMGLTNAFFVGLSIPLAMALSYLVIPAFGFTLNMLVMFAFIFALGIVVDDAIVVIENTHRIFKKTGSDITTAAKFAAGEVFIPILSGTLTTLAPFFPLAFWPGIVGTFMYYIPVTLIVALFSSLIVAYLFNPVFAVTFMKHDDTEDQKVDTKKILKISGIIALISLLFYLPGWRGIGNFGIFIAIVYCLHNIYGFKILLHFQHIIIPKTLNFYEKTLRWVLEKSRPYYILGSVIVLLFISFVITVMSKPKVFFFPDSEPNNIYAYIKLPVGTDVKVTDSLTRVVEKRISLVLGDNNPIVESTVSNVALGASGSMFDSGNKTSNRGKVSVNFIEYGKRNGISSSDYLDKIRKVVKDIPGTEITVEKNRMGPQTGAPINIEVSSDNLEQLVSTTHQLMHVIDTLKIPGIEALKSDFDNFKPELLINIDRERANREGITTRQVGSEIRTAILGTEASKYRDGEDQYPIQIRYSRYQRESIDRLMNLKITYRDMTSGTLRQIPLSSVADIRYQNAYGGIKRKNLKRVITITSNVLSGYTPNEINADIQKAIDVFPKPNGLEIKITGEREDQKESMAFLGKAMLLSLFLIMFILITQFNSISKPIIIISEVLFSIIGVLLGFFIFHMSFSIIMTGMGIVALAGIVVRNGILLVEFTDVLKAKGLKTRDAIIEGAKTRITPVMLTATATILGLIPLAIGLNINFKTLFTSLNPQIHLGGDTTLFFGPLSWTIIFGLSFATFLTLVIIPVMYYIMYAGQVGIKRRKTQSDTKKINFDDLV
jgi:multidrug efflux pump